MTAAGVAGVQDWVSFAAMITLAPVLFLLAVLKVRRIAYDLAAGSGEAGGPRC